MTIGEPPRIVRVEIAKYKNLRDVVLEWRPALALYGPNGIGKTNLLECLAILMGTRRTLELASPRFARVDAGALSMVVEQSWAQMPYSPHLANSLTKLGEDFPAAAAAAASADRDWWHHIGVMGDQPTFADGLLAAGVDDVVVSYLTAIARPLVRYRVESFTLDGLQRRYSRTLVVESVPSWFRDQAAELPDVFAPLRSGDPGAPGPVPVLELPRTTKSPVVLEWLARPRTEDEIEDDLRTALDHAADRAYGLRDYVGALVEEVASEGDDVEVAIEDWLRDVGASAANAEIGRVVPGLGIHAQH